MSTELDNWLGSATYLPKPLRDFHDAKEVFKTMHATMRCEEHEYAGKVSWVVGQCYVIDLFLYWMARRGYTLQRSRINLPFRSLEADIEERRKSESASFLAFLEARQPTPPTSPGMEGEL